MAIALVVAGTVNIAMLLLAATGCPVRTTPTPSKGRTPAITATLGPAVGIAFGIGLLASGLASTSVGSYAGATIMGGLLRVRVPLLVRRVVTLIPALVVLAIGVDPTRALVLSQVLLSVGLPFALIPLVAYTSRRNMMGAFVNRRLLTAVAWVATGLVVLLNVTLVVLTVSGAA